MNCQVCTDYAKETDPVPKKKPRPKKEVTKKPDPKKIFDGAATPFKPKQRRKKR
jgi:hypothetical protein